MIEGLKPYPKMKDSGVEWLGEVPEHWEVAPIGHIGQLFRGRGDTKEDEVASGVPCIRYGDLYTRHEFFIRSSKACVAPEKAAAYTSIRYGDVLFAASGETIEDIGRSAVNLLSVPACCGGDVLVLRPTMAVNPAFLGYAADAPSSRNQKASMGRGFTVVHIYASQLKRLTLAIPPLAEQSAIVRFLDYADRRIRRYVRAKQKLIELLEEQKHAVIHRAVTRGLDPNIRLRPSGVEWLGEVPEHWEVARNKTVCRVGTGHTPSRRIREYWADCTVPWFTLADVHRIRGDKVKYVRATKEKISELGLANSAAVKLAAGTVILSRTASVGYSAILECEMATSQDFVAWTPGERVNGEFLLAVLRAMRPELKRLMHGSTHNTIYMPTLHAFRMPLPPYTEQRDIARYIDDVLGEVHRARDVAVGEISCMREYRIRLIADVVSGKLDVRKAAARLPEEIDVSCDEAQDDVNAEQSADDAYTQAEPVET